MHGHLWGLRRRRAAPAAQDPDQNPNTGRQSSEGRCWEPGRSRAEGETRTGKGPGAAAPPEQGAHLHPLLHRHPPLAVTVILGAELSRGQALIATIITTTLSEAQRPLPSLRFRDALNFKQMLIALIGEGEGDPHIPDVKTRCLPCYKDEESWEKQEPSPRLPAVPAALLAVRTGEALGSCHSQERHYCLHSLPCQGSAACYSGAGFHSPSPRNDSNFPIKAAPERGLL